MDMSIYTTKQIAEAAGVCVNTVRNYEKYGFISKSERADNDYRRFSDIHIMQMKICRLVFSPPYINSLIRKASKDIIRASAKKDFTLCKIQTDKYIKIIENELKKADEALKALENYNKPKDMNIHYDRREAAAIIGTTAEAIRNWERNGLIVSTRYDIKKVYNQNEIDIMRLIYVLLNSGFNLQKIYEALMFLRNEDNKKAVEALCDSYDFMYIHSINIIEKTKEVLASGYEIMKLLEENF